jgi:glycosyltransferase involved in cell wall biosynthesis
MSAPNGTWVVTAAYNEATVIAKVVADVRAAGYSLVVVDDGSKDATAATAAATGATVVRHPINLGQGAALQTAIEFALSQGAEIIVTFDADGQHRARDIAGLVNALEQHGADFALGSRFLERASTNASQSRRLTLQAATWFTRMTTGLRISDTHNGLRAMTRRGAQMIHLRQNRMAHASEILHQIAQSGLKYIEAPVMIEYSAYSLAKGQKLSDGFMILFDLLARRLHR